MIVMSARMAVSVQLQIAAPVIVGGLAARAVKVCDCMHMMSSSKQMLSCSVFYEHAG